MAPFEGTIAYRLNLKGTCTLHFQVACVLNIESGRHQDTKVVVFDFGKVQRRTIGNLVTVLVGKVQGKIILCLNGKGCEKPQT